jgi:hypothetical protein
MRDTLACRGLRFVLDALRGTGTGGKVHQTSLQFPVRQAPETSRLVFAGENQNPVTGRDRDRKHFPRMSGESRPTRTIVQRPESKRALLAGGYELTFILTHSKCLELEVRPEGEIPES